MASIGDSWRQQLDPGGLAAGAAVSAADGSKRWGAIGLLTRLKPRGSFVD
jgi:hypothetical protein